MATAPGTMTAFDKAHSRQDCWAQLGRFPFLARDWNTKTGQGCCRWLSLVVGHLSVAPGPQLRKNTGYCSVTAGSAWGPS